MGETWPTLKAPDGQTIHYAAPAFTKEQQELFWDRLAALEHGNWITVVHPGTGEPERASVVELLCSPRTKEIIRMKNIQLVSYYDLWNEKFGKTISR